MKDILPKVIFMKTPTVCFPEGKLVPNLLPIRDKLIQMITHPIASCSQLAYTIEAIPCIKITKTAIFIFSAVFIKI